MILIIGGMGFIGLNTAIRCLDVGESVVITQHSSNRVPDIIKDEGGTFPITNLTNAFGELEVGEFLMMTRVVAECGHDDSG